MWGIYRIRRHTVAGGALAGTSSASGDAVLGADLVSNLHERGGRLVLSLGDDSLVPRNDILPAESVVGAVSVDL